MNRSNYPEGGLFEECHSRNDRRVQSDLDPPVNSH